MMEIIENPKHKLGHWAEEKVHNYFVKGSNIVTKGIKIIGVQVDLKVESRSEIRLIEVKSIRSHQEIMTRIQSNQIERLKRAAHFLAQTQKKPVILELALVDYPTGMIEFIPLQS